MQLMPLILKRSIELNSPNSDVPIGVLVATSGDTGPAAVEGFGRLDNAKVMVLFPGDGVAEVQRRQLVTVDWSKGGKGRLIKPLAVTDGDFDVCQRLVKGNISTPIL